MQEEKQAAEKLRNEIEKSRADFVEQQVHIESLTKKIKDSLISSSSEGSVDLSKFRELEKMFNDSQSQVESLTQQLKTAKDTIEHHSNIAEGAEKQLQVLLEENEKSIKAVEAKLKEKEARVLALEERCTELQGELAINGDGTMAGFDLRSRLTRLETEHKSVKTDLDEANANLESAKNEIKQLTENLEVAENKYTREMLLHSNDLQVRLVIG